MTAARGAYASPEIGKPTPQSTGSAPFRERAEDVVRAGRRPACPTCSLTAGRRMSCRGDGFNLLGFRW